MSPVYAPFAPLPHAYYQAVRSLHKRSERDVRGEFMIEGEKLCLEALQAKAELRFAVVNAAAFRRVEKVAYALRQAGVEMFQTNDQKFQQLCDSATPQGIIGVVGYPALKFDMTKPIIALDAIADPGNVGTIIRTADWFGFHNIVLGAGCADRFNPKVLRSTMGSVFRCAVATASSLAVAIKRDFPQHRFFGAALGGTLSLEGMGRQLLGGAESNTPDTSNTPPASLPASLSASWGIVFGSESHGISPEVAATLVSTFQIEGAAGKSVAAPQLTESTESTESTEAQNAESLNVAIAAGIILQHCFAATR
jgi:RNA methyltransferase, TrmH family